VRDVGPGELVAHREPGLTGPHDDDVDLPAHLTERSRRPGACQGRREA
jgi:hypothetical protein